jgi:DNA-directed RNA polymerase specialized sigma24 family protein
VATPDPKRRPPLTVADEALDDEEAPISDARPSSPAADPALLEARGPFSAAEAPLPADDAHFPLTEAPSSPEAAALPVTRALTKAFLAKKAAQDRIREVVEYRVPRGTQKADVNDLIQEANLRAVATSSLARSVPGMRAWVSRIAQNAVVDHFRGNARHLKWLDRSVDVQGLPPDAALEVDPLEGRPEDPAAAQRPIESIDERSLQQWLETQVKTKADHLTLEMIRQKAAAGMANAALAAEFGITEGAYDQRVQRFKAKWVPRWKQYRKERQWAIVVLLAVGGAALLVAALWWLLYGPKKTERIGPTEGPDLRPVPTASTPAPEPDRFNQAQPTHREPLKPEPLKPEPLKP